jgi:hypothetical protein
LNFAGGEQQFSVGVVLAHAEPLCIEYPLQAESLPSWTPSSRQFWIARSKMSYERDQR